MKGQRTTAIVIEFSLPEQANKALANRLVWRCLMRQILATFRKHAPLNPDVELTLSHVSRRIVNLLRSSAVGSLEWSPKYAYPPKIPRPFHSATYVLDSLHHSQLSWILTLSLLGCIRIDSSLWLDIELASVSHIISMTGRRQFRQCDSPL